MPEVSDQDLAVLQNAYKLLKDVEANPDAKPLLEKAIKTVKPEVVTEEDIAARFAKPYVEQINALQAKLDETITGLSEREKAAEQARVEGSISTAFDRLKAHGYTDDGLEKIKTIMVDRKIADPEAAAALFDKLNPPQMNEQSSFTPAGWEIGSTANDGADLKLLFKDEDRYADIEAAKVLNEMRSAAGS